MCVLNNNNESQGSFIIITAVYHDGIWAECPNHNDYQWASS